MGKVVAMGEEPIGFDRVRVLSADSAGGSDTTALTLSFQSRGGCLQNHGIISHTRETYK